MTNNLWKNILDEFTKTSKLGPSKESLNADLFFSFLPKLFVSAKFFISKLTFSSKFLPKVLLWVAS